MEMRVTEAAEGATRRREAVAGEKLRLGANSSVLGEDRKHT